MFSRIMEPLRSQVVYELSLVLHPELGEADNAFQNSRLGGKSQEMLDKELRAVMLRLMTQILQVMRWGYELCHKAVQNHCIIVSR